MKNLTYKELLEAPARVQFLYWMASTKQPVGSQMIEDAIKESPEYFPDELEHRRKWALIPQCVHDEYWAGKEKLRTECYKDMPPSKGIIGWAFDESGDDYNNWNTAYQKCREIEKPLAEALHKKYYGQYGIEYNGW